MVSFANSSYNYWRSNRILCDKRRRPKKGKELPVPRDCTDYNMDSIQCRIRCDACIPNGKFIIFDGDMRNYDEMEIETSDNLTPEELGLLHEEEINQIFESMPYEHEVFGLDLGYLQLQNEQGIAVTEFNKDETYSVVTEITNTDDFEKNIQYTVGMFNWQIGFEESTSGELAIPAFGTVTVSHDNMAITIPENYEIVLQVVDVDRVNQLLEEYDDAGLPSWKPYFEILNLTESQ